LQSNLEIMQKQVFISSTTADLEDYRDAVVQAISKMHGYWPVNEKGFSAADHEPAAYCDSRVRECDLFVGILGHWYGGTPEGSTNSYTKQEYETARSCGISTLMFLASDDFRIPARLIAKAHADLERQLQFREQVQRECISAKAGFKTPHDLALQVIQAIHDWHHGEQTERALMRSATLQELLRELVFNRDDDCALSVTFERLTKNLADTLGVARASVWLYFPDMKTMTCQYFHPSSANMRGFPLLEEEFPRYFRALRGLSLVDVKDTRTDSRTLELSKYFEQYNVRSMLDIPIKIGRTLRGIICHEHVGGSVRNWSVEDTSFSMAVANLAALAIEKYERDPERVARGELYF
jgi:GAF domain-containing protein